MNIKDYSVFYDLKGGQHTMLYNMNNVYKEIIDILNIVMTENDIIKQELENAYRTNPNTAFNDFKENETIYFYDFYGNKWSVLDYNKYADELNWVINKNKRIFNEAVAEYKEEEKERSQQQATKTTNTTKNSEPIGGQASMSVPPQTQYYNGSEIAQTFPSYQNNNAGSMTHYANSQYEYLSKAVQTSSTVIPQPNFVNQSNVNNNNVPANNEIFTDSAVLDQSRQYTEVMSDQLNNTSSYSQPENVSNPVQNNTPITQQANVTNQPNSINNNVPAVADSAVLDQQWQHTGIISNKVNTLPQFRASEVKNEKHKHQYAPMVFDNQEACVTYVVQLNVDSSERLAMKDYSQLSRQLLNAPKRDITDIGRIYVVKAMNYGSMIKLEIWYINANENRQHKELYVDKSACEQGKIYDEFINNGVHCFNTKINHKKISEYMYKLVLSKMDENEYDLPSGQGFNYIDNKLCFVTKEYCEENGYPNITDLTFKMDIKDECTSEIAEKVFIDIMNSHTDKLEFLLLNIIRIAGLLSYVLSIENIKFNRIVFINGDSRKLVKYLQIYDRNSRIIRPYSINVKNNTIDWILESESDCVLMFEDKASDSEFTKKNGVEAINYLCDHLFDLKNDTDEVEKYIIAVFSERLGQIIDSKSALNLDYSTFREYTGYGNQVLMAAMYFLDDLIIKRVCGNNEDFIKCVCDLYVKYETKAKECGLPSDVFPYLMVVYHELIRQYHKVGIIVTEEAMEEYLVKLIKKSDETYNDGSITEEFKTKLNKFIIDEKIELVENSEINNCFGSSGNVPVVFCDEDWLYFPKEAFEYIVQGMTLANNANAVRKSLDENDLLKTLDALTYKVTLYDVRYSGRTNVTAVKLSVLSKEALLKKRGGMYNYEPCVDDGCIERIPLGTDENGRTIYWSIGHEGIGNTHLMVNGTSGAGKTTAVNMIVKKLIEKGKHIIYVDFSNSNSKEQFEKTGFDKQFQDKNCYHSQIKECLSDEGNLNDAIELLKSDNPILIFESDKYDKETETFMSMLYDKIKADTTLDVFLVIDEVHKVEYKKGSAIYTIIEEGRKHGVSLISIFHGSHETKPKQYSLMNQAELKLIFKMKDQNDAQDAVDANTLKPPGRFTEKVMMLKKGNCLVVGNLESADGELMERRFVKIKFNMN